jgi:hypothetical protein
MAPQARWSTTRRKAAVRGGAGLLEERQGEALAHRDLADEGQGVEVEASAQISHDVSPHGDGSWPRERRARMGE